MAVVPPLAKRKLTFVPRIILAAMTVLSTYTKLHIDDCRLNSIYPYLL
jgi:hypothetical protein